jgi:DNA polymerase I-like protein with 3'-5' exonuclease and polymerase domains
MINFPLKVRAVDGTDYKVQVWSGEYLGDILAADSETTLAPFHTRDHRLVAFQAYSSGDTIYLVRKRSLQRFFNVHSNSSLVWQNAPFDVQVLMHELPRELLLSYYDRNLIYDTKILYTLLQLAVVGQTPQRDQSSLKAMYKQMFNLEIDKNNSVRTSFDQFMDKEYEDMTVEHAGYAALDVVYTMQLFNRLMDMIKPHDVHGTILSAHLQCKADLVLDQIYKNGIKIHKETKEKLARDLELQLVQTQDVLSMWGWIRGKAGINDQYERIVTRLGIKDKLPLTDSGKISSKASDLEEHNHLPFIKDFLHFQKTEKMLSFLKNANTDRIHPQYNVLVNTGRTSCFGGKEAVNLQQIPKGGIIRSMFIPEEGKKLYDVDFSTLEMCTLAQVLLDKYGYSKLADTINAGKDIHRYYASVLFSKDEAEVTKKERQQAKAAVFGFPGGLGIDTFIQFARGYGLTLNVPQATVMRHKYFEAFPEMGRYLNECNEGDVCTRTGRKRANATYCAVANNPFQGLGADLAKQAGWDLFKAGYIIVGFIHDAYLCEEDPNDTEHSFERMCQIMINAGKEYCPDVTISVEGFIRDRWE